MENLIIKWPVIKKIWAKKKFRNMRLTLYALLLAVVHSHAIDGYAQATKLDLTMENTTVKEVLHEIEHISQFRFLYNSKMVDVKRNISVDFKGFTIDRAMDFLFKDTGVEYRIVDRQVVLFSNDAPAGNSGLLQQQSVISGKVTDATGQALPGVTVVVKGTTQGTITNPDGEYSLVGISDDATLVFSFVGMKTQEIEVGNQTTINVEMLEDVIGLEEVVAIGYGTMQKGDLTGSVVKADLETFAESPNTNILESLKGTVPGLEVGQTVQTGQVPDMLIRGQTTLAGSNAPLVVVDGVIFRGSLNDLNPADIESIDILKDASAAAVYGSQATNGVILLTTTRGGGIMGKPIISYSGSYSYKSPVRELPPPGPDGFYEQTALSDITFSRTEESGYLEEDPSWEITNIFSVNEEVDAFLDGRTTNWYDAVTNDFMYTQEHNLSMSNSTEYTNYLVSLGYNDQTGYMRNEGYERFTGRINLDNTVTDWLEIGVQSFMSISDYSGAQASPNDRYIEPYATDTDANGERYRTILAGRVNPYLQFERDDFDQSLYLFGNLYAEINFPFIKGLSYKINFANNYKRLRRYWFESYGADFLGEGQKYTRFRYDLATDNILTFKRMFNEVHNLQVTLVYGLEQLKQDDTRALGRNYINDVLGYNRLQVAESEMQQAISGAWEESSLYSMARAFYGFNNKYLFTGTVRRDGYSGFGEENKIGVFPSLSFAWNAAEESFIGDNLSWLDQLKLRASYGTVGNRTIGRYQTLARVSGSFNFINMSHTPVYTQSVSSLESPGLKWEKTTGVDLGIDFAILSQKVMGTIDYYNNNTTDLFYYVDIPAISRYTKFPDNLGKLHNHGLELSITSMNVQRSDFEWMSTVTFSRNRNELKELLGFDLDGDGKEDDLISEGLFIGESIDAIYDYEIDGKWQVTDDIPRGYDLGAYKPVDQNGDDVIDPLDDKKIIGYKTPAYTIGLNNVIRYRNWSFKFFIHSIQGGNNYYLGRDDYRDFSIENSEMHFRYIFPEDVDFWTPENPNARYQRPDINTASGLAGNQYGDRSFIRLQNISLSYDLPDELLRSSGLQNARIYLNGRNLLTFTKWNGWDPETNQTITRDGRPVMKSYTIGLNVEF